MEQKWMEYNDTYDTPILISSSMWNRIQRYIRSYDVIFSKLCQNYKELDLAEIRYYRLNQILLSIAQLWPYDKSTNRNIKGIFLIFLLMSITFFQLTTFLTFKYTTDFFVSVLSYGLIGLLSTFFYYYFYINLHKIKKMWGDIYDIWNDVQDEEERNIMRWYSCLGELFTLSLILFGIAGFGTYASILFSPLILDTIFPLNESRPVLDYASTEYFIDGEKYYYPILCHWLLCIYVECVIVIAVTTFLVVYIQHICGLLNIACYRIERATDESVNLSNCGEKDCNFVQKLRNAVNAHRKALKYAEFLLSTFTSLFAPLILIFAASLILNLFRLFRAIISQNVPDVIIAFFVCSGHVITLFYINYYGQLITDHDAKVFKKAYEVQWYAAPADVQKLLLFVMKITTRIYPMSIGNVLVASVETFSNLSKMCLSYLTIIYSLMEW